MEVLRNLFATLTAGIIRLLVTVGILVAVYFLLVKPALHTTEKVSHEVNVKVQNGLKRSGVGEIAKTIGDVGSRVQREIRRSFQHSRRHGQAQQLVRCLQQAHQDAAKIQRCTAKY